MTPAAHLTDLPGIEMTPQAAWGCRCRENAARSTRRAPTVNCERTTDPHPPAAAAPAPPHMGASKNAHRRRTAEFQPSKIPLGFSVGFADRLGSIED